MVVGQVWARPVPPRGTWRRRRQGGGSVSGGNRGWGRGLVAVEGLKRWSSCPGFGCLSLEETDVVVVYDEHVVEDGVVVVPVAGGEKLVGVSVIGVVDHEVEGELFGLEGTT